MTLLLLFIIQRREMLASSKVQLGLTMKHMMKTIKEITSTSKREAMAGARGAAERGAGAAWRAEVASKSKSTTRSARVV